MQIAQWHRRRRYRVQEALFDTGWYLTQAPDAGRYLGGPVRHYNRRGWRQGLDPSPLFSTRWYLANNPHIEAQRLNPFWHYVMYGAAEGRSPHPLFDTAHYANQCRMDGHEAPANPLLDFVTNRVRWKLSPHPLFDVGWYLAQHPDVEAAGKNPLVHFVTRGASLGHWPNEFFDPDYYLSQEPSLADDVSARANPLIHYLLHGAGLGRNPHLGFDTNWYLMAHPDVSAAGMNPLIHFVLTGRSEGREQTGEVSARWFAAQSSPDRGTDGRTPAAEYLRRRSAEGLATAKDARSAVALDALRRFVGSEAHIRLPMSARAPVTVVIVVWNQAHFTLACLESLGASSVPVSTIVVDNASTDDTTELLNQVDGITVIRNGANVGFLEAANAGLSTSESPFTLLLNNDAMVAPDAIERAMEALADPSVGAVSGRIVLPNGLLQEAGSFLWRDGSAQGYLRGQPASIGAAMHRREVDFGSGAFLLLRTSVAQELGGLDPAFKPAYGEEVDLCLRMRAVGYRTVYDPRVLVEHVEFASSTDPSAALALQEEHRAVLEERHRAVLADRPMGDLKLAHRVAHWATRGLPGVLVVDDRIPFPTHGSGNPRAREVVREITASHDGPTLLAPSHQEPFADWEPVWAEFGLDLEIYPEPGMPGLGRLMEQHAGRYDTVWVSRHHNLKALLAAEERHPGLLDGVRVVYDAEAVTALREAQQAALLGEPWTPEQVEAAETAEVADALRADVVLAVNDLEADLFRAHGARDVRVLGHGLEVRPGAARISDRSGLVFVGRMVEEDSPNVDSLRWFFDQVWPLWPEDDRPSLTLVGRVAPALEEEFSAHGALVSGPVDDVRPFLDPARVFIAPTRFAAGVPHKVHEAAAAGIPVVATPLLVNQLGWTAGRDLLAAADPEGFFDAVNALLGSAERWAAVRQAALERVREDCDPEAFRAVIRQVLADRPGST